VQKALRKLQRNPSILDRLFKAAYSNAAPASSATVASNAEDAAPEIHDALIEEIAAETTNAQTEENARTEETYVQMDVSASVAVTSTPDTEGTRHFSH
jgi:type VI protein secretion system component VasK